MTDTGDRGPGTLRDAIDDSDCATIMFDPALNGQAIAMTSAQLTIGRDVNIEGPGADRLTVRRSAAAAGPFRIFEIRAGAVVEISGLTISGGDAGADGAGGGILNHGTLKITGATIAGNRAGRGGGGGISTSGTLVVTHSTISINYSPSFSGGVRVAAGDVNVANTTISGNYAGTSGGGIATEGRLTVRHSTIAQNSAPDGGNISLREAVTFSNTIIAGNGDGNCSADAARFLIDAGYNLEDGTGCGLSASTSRSSVDPGLGGLDDNGGPTGTHALLVGSPAIDAGTCEDNDGNPVADDQRGVWRPQGFACDIGAFETENDLFTVLIALSEESGVSFGTVNKLRDAFKHARKQRTVPACNALAEYIEDLTNQAGKRIEDAAGLIQAAQRIRRLMGC